MSIERYFNNAFRQHIGQLQFRPVPQVVKDIFNDPALVLFGGAEWENVKADLNGISQEDLPKFVLCLFAVVLTDQCMHRYFKSSYGRWRVDTQYPKFGWNRFGLFNENPLKLLAVPEQVGLLDVSATVALIPEFLMFYKKLVDEYCQSKLPNIGCAQFLSAVLQDDLLQFNQGVIVGEFIRLAGSKCTRRVGSQSVSLSCLAAV